MKLLKKKLLSLFLMLALLGSTSIFGFDVEVKASEPEVTMAVHFLDVGQGLSILVQSGGQNLVYDGGGQSTSSFVVSYLQQQQVSTIDYLISSHYDADHVSGLIGCLNAFNVSNVIGADYVYDSSLYGSFMDAVSANGLSVQHPQVGDSFSFGTGSFTILSPSTISSDSNNNSVALKLSNGNDDFIFTGDAEYSSEADMVNCGINLDCDVLCIGHHGSASSTSWDFLQATVPEYAVISCGADNQYNHPDADTMDKLSSMEIDVFRTDKQGTIAALSTGSGISWTTNPCNDYTPGSSSDTGTVPTSEAESISSQESSAAESQAQTSMVWLSATGEKYHSIPNCGRMNPDKARQVSLSDAIAQGYDACSKCF
jgi:beta-lactamase superfamily II metal-dependent hydrolase